MRVIIAGGRDYNLTDCDLERLSDLHNTYSFEEIVSGCARGVDTDGERFAESNNIPVKRFPADWNRYGKRAGAIRNGQMAQYADAVILFKGGKGTQNMFEQAKNAGLFIIDLR